jgi:hypothetical protein
VARIRRAGSAAGLRAGGLRQRGRFGRGIRPELDRCWDADNDSFAGFESAGYAATVCAEPSDRADGDLAISPVASETCDSGVDEECDGLVDAADVADCGGPPILALGAPAAIALAALLAVAGAKGLRRRAS